MLRARSTVVNDWARLCFNGLIPPKAGAKRRNRSCVYPKESPVDYVWVVKIDWSDACLAAAYKGWVFQEERAKCPQVRGDTFTPKRKRMTTIHATPKGKYAYSKGAPEVILGSCTKIYRYKQ